MKAKAAFLEGIRTIKFKEIEVPDPGFGEVLVKIKSVGVCGSDVHYYTHGKIGDFVVKEPLILGHESAGEVVKVGPGVKALKPGDRVALEPGVPCGQCEYCKTGRYNLCPDVKFMATPPINGAFVEYVVHPESFCFKLPDNVSYDEGAMFEPLSVGLWAVERANLRPASKIAILGAGTIGMTILLAAKVVGAAEVVMFDVVDFRVNKARELGANAINVSDDRDIYDELSGSFDAVFEAAGNEETIKNSLKLVKRGGKIVFIGLTSKDEIALNVNMIGAKEVDILGLFRYANMYPRCVELVGKGLINLKPLITRYFDFSEVQQALEFSEKEKHKSLKTIVVFK